MVILNSLSIIKIIEGINQLLKYNAYIFLNCFKIPIILQMLSIFKSGLLCKYKYVITF